MTTRATNKEGAHSERARGFTVLLIEGNAKDAGAVADLLDKAQQVVFDILHVSTLSKALDRLTTSKRIDAVLLALSLPDSRGTEAFERVSAVAPDLPVVLLSADGDQVAAKAAVRLGAHDEVSKRRLCGPLLEKVLGHAMREQQLKRELRGSEARFRALAANMPAANALLDSNRFTYINAGAEAVSGYTKDDRTGSTLWNLIAPEPRDLVSRKLAALRTGATSLPPEEIPVLRKDGEVRFQELAATGISCQPNPAILNVGIDVSARKQAEERIAFQASLLDQVKSAVIATDREGNVIYWNKYAETLYQWTANEVFGRNIVTVNVPERSQQEAAEILRSVLQHGRWEGDFVAKRKDGSEFPTFTTLTAFNDQQGVPAGLVGVSADRTEWKQREEQVRRLSQVIEQSPSIVVLTDTEGRIRYVNRRFEEVTGYRPDEVTGKRSNILKSGHTTGKEYETLWQTIKSGRMWQGEFHNRKKSGELYWEHVSIFPIKDEHGAVSHYVKLGEDVTKQRVLRERVEFLTFHDSLTDLPNRALALDRLGQLMSLSQRTDASCGLLWIDLDDFKVVNDSLGHASGDQLLVEVARRLESHIRQGDTLARIGGDDFIVLLNDLRTPQDAALVAQKLLDALAEPLPLGGQEVFPGASIGIAIYPDDGATAEELLQHAERAMHGAKEQGKNSYQFLTHELNERALERIFLESAMHRALTRHEYYLNYQPRVDLLDGRIIGVEALVRWRHPELGVISPARFIPIAESTGLIHPLGKEVLRQACRQAELWRAAGMDLPVAVNLSARQLQHPDIVTEIEAALAETSLPAKLLELEVTETAAMSSVEHTVARLHELRELGVTIWIDDFGTAYSSLSRLKRLPVSGLKIDQSFVRDLGDQPDARSDDGAIIGAIVALAKGLRLEVLGEGIETEAQRRFLMSVGCRWAQGFLFSRPLPADELTPRLRAGERLYAAAAT